MFKYPIAVTVVFGLAFYVFVQDQKDSKNATYPSTQDYGTAIPEETYQKQTDNPNDESSRNSPRWHRFFAWPDGVTAWIILLTLFAIADQTQQTAKAAKASQRAVEHSIASERAWILVERVETTSGARDRPEGESQVFIQCAAKNHGKTAARVLGMNAQWTPGPISDPGQTWDERLYDFDPKSKPKWVILPNKASAVHCSINGFKAQPGERITVEMQKGHTLHIHGVIRYWDMFSQTDRFTQFCYRWEQRERGEMPQECWYQAGGDRYNKQT